jgi:hypothetical protein
MFKLWLDGVRAKFWASADTCVHTVRAADRLARAYRVPVVAPEPAPASVDEK